MFTGIIQGTGTLSEKKSSSNSAVVKITTDLAPILKLGDSIAVNGVCLTAAALGSDWFKADIMPETYRGTNLANLQSGDQVNLEPALALGDRLGGHMVSGHVDGVGRVTKIQLESNALVVQISVPADLTRFIALKGSVAVNGVSLTVQKVATAEFGISLIPHTMQATNLLGLKPGDQVNIEVDLLARYIAHLMENKNESVLSVDFLAEHGFK